jgi:uncharacterized membrane protein YcaP (DUF421 family)
MSPPSFRFMQPRGGAERCRTGSLRSKARKLAMFDMSMGAAEHVVRAVAVYTFLFLFIRFIGKKHVGELTPFDLLVLLILSETTQNALVGDDKSLFGCFVSAGTLLLLVQGMSLLSWKFKAAARFLEGTPKVLIRHGRTRREVAAKERISVSELTEALRRHGCTDIGKVRTAVLENDGKITVVMRDER